MPNTIATPILSSIEFLLTILANDESWSIFDTCCRHSPHPLFHFHQLLFLMFGFAGLFFRINAFFFALGIFVVWNNKMFWDQHLLLHQSPRALIFAANHLKNRLQTFHFAD